MTMLFSGVVIPIASASDFSVPSCPFIGQADRVIVNFNTSAKLYSSPFVSSPVSVSLPAGDYKISLFSYDGYANRVNVSQVNESWYVWLKKGGTLIAQSNTISDLADNVAQATKNEVVNASLFVSQAVDSVTAVHSTYPSGTNAGSVYAVCAAFDLLTPNDPPAVETQSATNINENNATINGRANPKGEETTVWFKWGPSSVSLYNQTPEQSIGSGMSYSNFNFSLSGLAPDTTYYFQAYAKNSAGTVYGSILSFRTQSSQVLEFPLATTESATNIDEDSATLRGEANPKGTSATVWFEWGTSSGSLNNRTSERNIGSGNSYIDESESISGLSDNTTYYFRIVVENSNGRDNGSILSFRTDDGDNSCVAPLAYTNQAGFLTENSATLRGTINPRGYQTKVWFEYGENYSLGSQTTYEYVGSGQSDTDFVRYLSSLSPNKTYYFRIVADSNCGRTNGSIQSFTTHNQQGSLPIAITLPYSNLTSSSVLLNGQVNPNNSQTTVWFEWGFSSSLATYYVTSSSAIGSATGLRDVSSFLSSLASDTLYYYRVAASNQFGAAKGSIMSFRTVPVYVPTPTPITPPVVTRSFTLFKETRNLSFPNGTETINASSIGDIVEYVLNVKNTGNSNLNNVVVEDNLSSYYDFVESRPDINYTSSGNILVWNIDSIRPGETETIIFKAKARSVEKSVVVYNDFTVRVSGIERTSNKTTTILNPALMSLDITSDRTTVRKNEQYNYTVRYRNIGIADTANVMLKIITPEDTEILGVSSAGCSRDKNILFCQEPNKKQPNKF